jgi:tetratricopeptide (TPR) repeat protein
MELYKEGTYLIHVIGRLDKKERMAEGISRLEQALELDPNFAAAHVSLGNAYWLSAVLGLYEKKNRKNQEKKFLAENARMEYRKAVKLDPTNVEAHKRLASTTRDSVERIRHYKRVLELDPQQKIKFMIRAHIAESEGKVQEAFNYLIQGLSGTKESDRCSLVKGPFSSVEYGLGWFQKKYPDEYKAYVDRVCSRTNLPPFQLQKEGE